VEATAMVMATVSIVVRFVARRFAVAASVDGPIRAVFSLFPAPCCPATSPLGRPR